MKKRKFKKWVLYLLFIIALLIFFVICDKIGLVEITYSIEKQEQGLNMTRIILIVGAWEILKASVKAILKREKEKE